MSSAAAAEPGPRRLAVVRRHLADPNRLLNAAFGRKTIDPDLIESLMDSATPALAEGLL